MERLRTWALRIITALVMIATIVSFGESYSGNYHWALGHGVTGFWGGVWPLMIDVIILVAEAGLFVAHHDKWRTRDKVWMWTVLLTALGVSVGSNTGHITSTDWLTHLTAALPPLALAFALTVGFGVMKRTFVNKPAGPPAQQPLTQAVSAPRTEMVQVPRKPVETKPAEKPPVYDEKPAPQLPPDDFEMSATMVNAGLQVIPGKSFTMDPDPRRGLDLKRKRVRDMYDVDPDIAVNAIAKALEIAWATAARYLAETKEARGLELTDKERSYLTSTA